MIDDNNHHQSNHCSAVVDTVPIAIFPLAKPAQETIPTKHKTGRDKGRETFFFARSFPIDQPSFSIPSGTGIHPLLRCSAASVPLAVSPSSLEPAILGRYYTLSLNQTSKYSNSSITSSHSPTQRLSQRLSPNRPKLTTYPPPQSQLQLVKKIPNPQTPHPDYS